MKRGMPHGVINSIWVTYGTKVAFQKFLGVRETEIRGTQLKCGFDQLSDMSRKLIFLYFWHIIINFIWLHQTNIKAAVAFSFRVMCYIDLSNIREYIKSLQYCPFVMKMTIMENCSPSHGVSMARVLTTVNSMSCKLGIQGSTAVSHRGLLIRWSWIMHLQPKRGTLGMAQKTVPPNGCI